MSQKQLILASASPRRKELLTRLTDQFHIMVCEDAEYSSETLPHLYVMELAKHKACAVGKHLTSPSLVIGADTIVVQGDLILGKPKDKEDAVSMLLSLQGKTHHVLTGLALLDTETAIIKTYYEKTAVTMVSLTEDEIRTYVDTKEPMDKAGSYAVQGIASKFIKSIEGNYDNVVGLPLCLLRKKLREEGFTV